MTDKTLLELLSQYTTNPAPEGTPVMDIAGTARVAEHNVVPFVHMGFIWVHSGSFRRWITQHTGVWISQKSVPHVFRKQGWNCNKSVRTIQLNLWGIPLEETKHDKAAG